jgi:O-acetylhomoserine (thiol)-lyase
VAVAKYLDNHKSVSGVQYGGLKRSEYHKLAKKYTNGKPASLLTFGIKGGYKKAEKFYDALGLFKRLVNIGDAKSLACHPASTTHRQMTVKEQANAGVTQDLLRLCVGIEHIDDIIADLEQAFKAANRRKK